MCIANLPKILFNSNFDFALIYDGKQVVHYTGIYLTRSFQYPFMEKEDLQLGPAWTHEQHRRKGLASYALHEILKTYESRNRTFWATIKENNTASIRYIERGGFLKYATGIKKTFGIYSLKKVIKSINATEGYTYTRAIHGIVNKDKSVDYVHPKSLFGQETGTGTTLMPYTRKSWARLIFINIINLYKKQNG